MFSILIKNEANLCPLRSFAPRGTWASGKVVYAWRVFAAVRHDPDPSSYQANPDRLNFLLFFKISRIDHFIEKNLVTTN